MRVVRRMNMMLKQQVFQNVELFNSYVLCFRAHRSLETSLLRVGLAGHTSCVFTLTARAFRAVRVVFPRRRPCSASARRQSLGCLFLLEFVPEGSSSYVSFYYCKVAVSRCRASRGDFRRPCFSSACYDGLAAPVGARGGAAVRSWVRASDAGRD